MEVKQLPQERYIIEFPFDPLVGTPMIASIIPYTDSDYACINNPKNKVLSTKQRLAGEDDFNFKMRLENIIEKIRKQRGLAHQDP